MDDNNNSNLPIDQASRNRMNRLSFIREHRRSGRFNFVRPRGSRGHKILDMTSNLHLLPSQNRLDISKSVIGVDVNNGSEIYTERTHLDGDSSRNLVSMDNHSNYTAFIQRRDVINSRTVVGVDGNVISTTTSTVSSHLVTNSMESNLLLIYRSAEVGSSSATTEGVSLRIRR
ncbi:high mobility group protein 1.2 [Corchorus capsularis]|uniref:High mobility group protein 1.2 n=1 Tax=Corchorus capsularis TaxID=210143 RepID=A0A1R3GSM3_COCAP|nr:high mobility group protein 1.2 [Corchorus capsularis]